MEAYLDNAATTKTAEPVIAVMEKMMRIDYGNPSSMHMKGFDAEKYVKESRQIIASSLKTEPKNIIFTSGGTEANNMAIIGTALKRKRMGMHIVTSVMEHASVYNPMAFLEEMGYEVTYVKVDQYGHIDTDMLKNSIREDTILVSIMMVNNEIGSYVDIEKIACIVKEKNEKTYLHVDAIQAYGKYKINPKKLNIDLMSVSGHKINGPKGSGFLYVADKVGIKPIIYGGGQERGMRSGTENVPAIAGLSEAVKLIYDNHGEKIQNMYSLKEAFIKKVMEINGVTVNAVSDNIRELNEEKLREAVLKTAPHIISVSFENIRSEVMLHALEDRGIYVSSGSACSSNHPSISGTLRAIGVKEALLDSTIRFSLGMNTTMEEIDYAIEVLKELVPIYSKYVRR